MSNPKIKIKVRGYGDIVAELYPEKAPETVKNFTELVKRDFYSGLIYSMLGIPVELFTPIFAIARMSGWSAHRIEELSNNGKIIRPAYDSVAEHQPYVRLVDRK